jgi:hypothetical protein
MAEIDISSLLSETAEEETADQSTLEKNLNNLNKVLDDQLKKCSL